MSTFLVGWRPDAEDELARLWLNAPDRQALVSAQAQIDRLLSQDPIGHGHHLSEGLHRIDVPPLSCTYTIEAAQKRVEVTWVWTT